MSNPNKHIENYLNEYLKMKSPGFAVMISGTWGCGKTYFIKDYIENNQGKKICYISLYGVNDIDEIDRRIFLALHPKLDGDYTDLVTHTFNGALTLIKGDKVISKLKFKDFIHAARDRALVFDDLERCSLAKKDVMGYINAFVEHKNNHVLVIANEDEISKQELMDGADAKDRSAYKRIREKLIGKTFAIDSNIRTVLPAIIKVVDQRACSEILMNNQPLLIEIFSVAQDAHREHNYRAFTNTLRDFEWFVSNLDSQYVKHENLMRDLLHFFVAVGYEIQLGALTAKDILEYHNELELVVANIKTPEEIPIHALLERHSISADRVILDKKLWVRTFENKAMLKKDLNEALANSVYFYQAKEPADYIKLWHWRDQEDDEAAKIIQTVHEGIASYKYTVPGQILHIFGSFLKLSELKVISESKAKVQADARAYIEHLASKNLFSINEGDRDIDDLRTFGYGNLGYTSENTEEFKATVAFLIEAVKKADRNQKVQDLPNILAELVKDPKTICDRLAAGGDLWAVDLLKDLDPQEFLNVFLKIPNKDKREVAFMLKNRYHQVLPEFDSILKNEHDFLCGLDRAIAKVLSEAKDYTPTLEQLKLTKDAYLSIAIKSTATVPKDQAAIVPTEPTGDAGNAGVSPRM